MFSDFDRKQANEDISKITADAFIDLYEFAKKIGDEVTIGEAKNANFHVKVDANQGDYQNNPSVFTENVTGDLKIWPARMIMDHDSGLDSVAWDAEDYHELERAFQSMNGVPQGSTTVRFETVGSSLDIDRFKSIVEMFVSTCRKKAQSPS